MLWGPVERCGQRPAQDRSRSEDSFLHRFFAESEEMPVVGTEVNDKHPGPVVR